MKTLTPEECKLMENHYILLLTNFMDPAITCESLQGCPTTRKNIRNYLMFRLMLDAGLRVGELVKLTLADCYFKENPVKTLIIPTKIGKGGRERSIPLSQRVLQALGWYYRIFPAHLLTSTTWYLFAATWGGKPLSTRMVERHLRSVAEKVLGRPVHPHMLRHTYGTRLMKVAPMRVVQEMLGHASINSTQIYTHVNDHDKQQAIEALNRDSAAE